ncbi:tetratricopeptide repeat protein [Shewanella sp. 4_MG-2023]|uniref:tetratricopeptide repeat protein n=1 Tax=Shewanella sp. 4_MG-2023 TaxID=3062652 RepID=UPI0026E2FD98|nr:tetratricopeptide repeat protein [Shewanella sp. 4_MG-2023]MDO6677304.1 tetratricopeptide repeat protein [Shewanella sp. 4_MG-2023]
MTPSKPTLSLLVSCMIIAGVSGCKSTLDTQANNNPKRATLTDLAKQQPQVSLDSLALTKAQRSQKLAQIYQQLLTLEPNPEVRTHVEYRLVQIKTENLEEQMFGELETTVLDEDTGVNPLAAEQKALQQFKQNDQQLVKLIAEYQTLLQRYPNRADNEHLQYQLAKALDLQGQLDESLIEMESLLSRYPNTQYLAELNFRRGEIYYNLQDYPAAISAYKQVQSADNNDKYLLNSIYMSGWSLFKLNRLPEADSTFLAVFDTILANHKPKQNELTATDFSFASLSSREQNLAIDAQRVLSISLSQQQQSVSLVALVTSKQDTRYLPIYQHILFDNLAKFLLKQELQHDAELAYQAYIDLAQDNIWSARYSLALLELYQRQGKFASMHKLKNDYINQYGLNSTFWSQASAKHQQELLPHLLAFSDEHSRRVYANAQNQPAGIGRVSAFKAAANALSTYLQLAKLPQASSLLSKDIHTDEYLFADANFEAKQFRQALNSYKTIAYGEISSIDDSVQADQPNQQADHLSQPNKQLNQEQIALKKQAAYATTITIREILTPLQNQANANLDSTQVVVQERVALDKQFIANYPDDKRALELATHGAQYSFASKNYLDLAQFSEFVLVTHGVINQPSEKSAEQIAVVARQTPDELASVQKPQAYIALDKSSVINPVEHGKQLPKTQLKQVQLVTQLYAHGLYQQSQYALAEQSYNLALKYLSVSQTPTAQQATSRVEMRDLLASSIYFQAQANKNDNPQLAVVDLLRISKAVPESKYAVSGEFEAANILLSQQQWQQAITVLVPFQKRYPKHQFSASIPAKLAQSYEALEQWELAAEQLLIIVANEPKGALKREAQYTAAEYYLKAGETEKARLTYRTYAKDYPEPFDVAQEVRLKMSEFYQVSNEPNKEYYWYRQILTFHAKQQAKANTFAGREIEIASIAASELAQAHQQTFIAIKLTAPLNKTLKRKQDAMKQAIGYYQQVLDFQRAQYVPQATFNLAEMYRQLAADVMDSERPSDLDELALEEYEILLEELAYPFEEKAIEIHISNTERAWQNIYDQWIGKSFTTLTELSPALYNKQEVTHDVVESIH